ncbi:histidinol-phosphatase [Xylariomycetidae sp. FL0641]|nr:histidinol-phosphatase [Xylariomycetidae sp. FL0641]
MAFTMHSHSGQFCPGHAKDQLEDVIQHAIRLGYTTMGLTEHMPRTSEEDLYPEELDDPQASIAALAPRHEAFLREAKRLQAAYADRIHLLVGFEGEWLRPAYGALVRQLAADARVDYFIGSLHHVDGIPIDYDGAWYAKARMSAASSSSSATALANITNSTITTTTTTPANGTAGKEGEMDEEQQERHMYAAYYDQQHAMLTALRPRVVGHFDLVRLLSRDPARDVRALWPDVWARMCRNLRAVAAYGGLLECNSSALRKGLAEPYPGRAVAEEWLRLGGRFTLSDDSHGIAQVGTNYARALDFLASLGVGSVWTFRRESSSVADDDAKATLVDVEVPLDRVRAVVDKW